MKWPVSSVASAPSTSSTHRRRRSWTSASACPRLSPHRHRTPTTSSRAARYSANSIDSNHSRPTVSRVSGPRSIRACWQRSARTARPSLRQQPGLCERLTQRLNELADEDIVQSHHGSVSHARRAEIEEGLKLGRIRGIVATSSLELGIDMGSIDRVVQIESPGSVARPAACVAGQATMSVRPASGASFPSFVAICSNAR